jgi:transcriptional regulator with XRE-family HTH domain
MTEPTSSAIARLRQMCRDGTAKRIREEANLSLTDVAKDVGCTHASIARYETGVIRPGAARCVAYLRVLDALMELQKERADAA